MPSVYFALCLKMTKKVAFFVDNACSNIEYSEGHMMQPIRLRLTNSLVSCLGLEDRLDVLTPRKATKEDLQHFHSCELVWFLQNSTAICNTAASEVLLALQKQLNITAEGECPLFARLWEAVSSFCGSSLSCADVLIAGTHRIAVNWSGGMHHAAEGRCSGFCYANDIVLCIQRLLTKFRRVLYIDLDVHHGDGVESAFARDPRVLTWSIHQYGSGFFPGTGTFDDIGVDTGLGFTLNVPLPRRSGDHLYHTVFSLVLPQILTAFAPESIVVQCGADTIFGDFIGGLRISTQTFASCVSAVLDTGLPTVLLGGGGYNVVNTARCWAITTAVAAGRLYQLPLVIPHADTYYEEYVRGRLPESMEEPLLHVVAPPSKGGPGVNVLPQLLRVLRTQLQRIRRQRSLFIREPELIAHAGDADDSVALSSE